MKLNMLFVIGLFLSGCHHPENDISRFQAEIDTLQQKLGNTYKPGLGEFMSGIQVHHAKLWFAGESGNWKLADFEVKEILESIADIRKYCTDRPEINSLVIIEPALDSISRAIRNNNASSFKNSFALLTIACNACHRTTQHEFNVIQQPQAPPFSNQDFKIQHK